MIQFDSPAHSHAESAGSGITLDGADPFRARYGVGLPRALRDEATGMSWQEFTTTYTGSAGPLRLGAWTTRPAASDMVECDATLARGDQIVAMRERAAGPIGALTSMLHRLGASVEVRALHQRETSAGVTTFLLCACEGRLAWSMGSAADAEGSGIRALIAGANRLA
ncbi:2-isopropylmalate synthase [Gordonia jinhuaensis]|uniref:2-isopropylmalate synthase LeuA allosteric (dimerisation) domain-containing protein n=1 Tax=Gordonia jinhuaensis TaxID=1517702 RepID=A0A916TEL2_9ACTN|nr:hypothetical protein [Gordonia jinhuaensis]GGB41938.1 hypothetical protein GCM10011489_31860 [Gordonia jinhuaensis]